MEKLAYSIADITAVTGLSRSFLYKRMDSGDLAFIKIGKRRLVTREQLAAFLNGQTV